MNQMSHMASVIVSIVRSQSKLRSPSDEYRSHSDALQARADEKDQPVGEMRKRGVLEDRARFLEHVFEPQQRKARDISGEPAVRCAIPLTCS